MNKIITRYNLQKNKKQVYGKNGIDNYISNRLEVRDTLAEKQEQEEENKIMKEIIIQEIDKSLKNILQ